MKVETLLQICAKNFMPPICAVRLKSDKMFSIFVRKSFSYLNRLTRGDKTRLYPKSLKTAYAISDSSLQHLFKFQIQINEISFMFCVYKQLLGDVFGIRTHEENNSHVIFDLRPGDGPQLGEIINARCVSGNTYSTTPFFRAGRQVCVCFSLNFSQSIQEMIVDGGVAEEI